MTDEKLTAQGGPAASRLIALVVALFFLIAITLLAGVGMAALLARQGAAADWSKWSNVGQTFGALSAIISGLALVAVVVAARAQSRELERQRNFLVSNNSANLRTLHLEILKISIQDPKMAEVWPQLAPRLRADLNRQYLYANVIYQFHWTSLQLGNYSDEEAISTLRYLFTSPLMRGYWHAATQARRSLSPGSAEYRFAQKVDEICRERDANAATTSRSTEDNKSLSERLRSFLDEPIRYLSGRSLVTSTRLSQMISGPTRPPQRHGQQSGTPAQASR
jgi:hypothetical protein